VTQIFDFWSDVHCGGVGPRDRTQLLPAIRARIAAGRNTSFLDHDRQVSDLVRQVARAHSRQKSFAVHRAEPHAKCNLNQKT
jgi:hypothetical protein